VLPGAIIFMNSPPQPRVVLLNCSMVTFAINAGMDL
jgi:hypothetical protein